MGNPLFDILLEMQWKRRDRQARRFARRCSSQRARLAALEARLAEVERERDAAVARLREIEAGAPAVRELRDAAVALADMVEEAARDDVPGILGRRALRSEERLAALTQAAGEAAETLDALIYWHDCGDIDRSWWEDAREKLAALRDAMGEERP